MKKYEKPEMNITALNNKEEVLLASGGINLNNFKKGGFNVIDTF